ncbi:MAG TPA: ExbD/TolR family protein [Oxalicibacterium sp.]|jgi:biopolymer transport protein TolR|nr:ExbD/TolR family protein [Oxalicibacterium sp.]
MAFSSSMRGGRNRKFKSEINVVPYIDVMLVLLIIFMVAAPITNPGVINLPNAAKSSLPPTEYIRIDLKADTTASIAINGVSGSKAGTTLKQTASGRAALADKLRDLHAEHPELPLMISADKDIKYDDVMQTMSLAKKLGIDRVALATKSQ